jgi:hypothetical protein
MCVVAMYWVRLPGINLSLDLRRFNMSLHISRYRAVTRGATPVPVLGHVANLGVVRGDISWLFYDPLFP